MSFDVHHYANAYYSNIQPSEGNDYPMLKAWEFIYEYVWDGARTQWSDLITEERLDTTALHIGFYLANWGMFRGSSNLLRNSNLDLMKALAQRIFSGDGPELFELSLYDFTSDSPRLEHNQNLVDKVLQTIESTAANISWTDTLKTKILMGVWGECAALDQYYIAACRSLFPRRNSITTASGKGLTALADLAQEIGPIELSLKTGRLKLEYPTAKIMDMALFYYGLEHVASKNAKKAG